MRHYILKAPTHDPQQVFIYSRDEGTHMIMKKRIYTSQKGEYVRVNTGDGRHRRKYLRDMERVTLQYVD